MRGWWIFGAILVGQYLTVFPDLPADSLVPADSVPSDHGSADVLHADTKDANSHGPPQTLLRKDVRDVIRQLEQTLTLHLELPEITLDGTMERHIFTQQKLGSSEQTRPIYVYQGPVNDDEDNFVSVLVVEKQIFVSGFVQRDFVDFVPLLPGQGPSADQQEGDDDYLFSVDTEAIAGLLGDPCGVIEVRVDACAPCEGNTDMYVQARWDDEFETAVGGYFDAENAAWGIVNGIRPLTQMACVSIYVEEADYLFIDSDNCKEQIVEVTEANVGDSAGDFGLLLTGKDIWLATPHDTHNTAVVGCAFTGHCCFPAAKDAVGVMEAPRDSWHHRMEGAHEIGHLLSGTHEKAIERDPEAAPPRNDCPYRAPPQGHIKCSILSARLLDSEYQGEYYSYGNSRAISTFADAHARSI